MRASTLLFTISQSPTSLGTRLAVIGPIALALIFDTFVLANSQSSLRMLETSTQPVTHNQEVAIYGMTSPFDSTMRTKADRFLTASTDTMPGLYSVDPVQTAEMAGKSAPTFKSGNTTLDLNFTVPDQFFAHTGGTIATVFVQAGDDLARTAALLKKENIGRAINTSLGRVHPSYKASMVGEPFHDLARLSGVPYMSKYEPVCDMSGRVIGVSYVGADMRSELALFKDKIRSHSTGKVSGRFIIDGKPGTDQGKMLIDHVQNQEGKNLLNVGDAAGQIWVCEMITRKGGMLRHILADTRAGTTREWLTVFIQYLNQ